jgi:nitrous oxide reductase accessory protein NosL
MKKLLLVLFFAAVVCAGCKKTETPAPAAPETPAAAPVTPAK